MVSEKYIRTLLFLLFFLISSPTSTAESSADILHYSIDLDIKPLNNSVTGSTNLILNASQDSELSLELDENLTIGRVSNEKGILNFTRNDNKVIIYFDRPLEGTNEILLEYTGVLDETVNDHSWAYMDEESSYAVYEASWYPRIAGDRASAFIRILVPPGWTAVSNGDLIIYEGEENRFNWVIESSEVGFSFAAGRYLEVQEFKKHMSVSCFLFAPKEGCTELLMNIFDFYSYKLTPYPYPKIALVEVRGELNGGHGDNSLIIMSTEIMGNKNFQEFVAHEAAHNWFGAMVSTKDSKWLTEGFTSYVAVMFLETLDMEEAKRSLNAKRDEYLSMRKRHKDQPILLTEETFDDQFHAIVYGKGAYVLHMLRYVVGDEDFSKALQSYVREYSGRSAWSRDFKRVVEDSSEMELGWFFEEWLNSTAIPDFSIDSEEVKQGDNTYFVKATLKQSGDIVKMPVDVSLITSKGEVRKRVWTDSKLTVLEFQTTYKPIMLEIDRDEWLLEENRFNNRFMIEYPTNLYGFQLLISNFSRWLRQIPF
jgi:aminopeptidase N